MDMTAQQAKTFSHRSADHEEYLRRVAAERGCQCEPYVDWYTYRRWRAQGYQVRKGEKGVELTTWIPITEEDEDGTEEVVGRRPWRTHVFCRCQVDRKEN